MTSDVNQLIAELTSQRFYGSLEIKFEAGRVVLLKKTETVKPTEAGERSTARRALILSLQRNNRRRTMESTTPQTLTDSQNADLNRALPAEVNVPGNTRPSLVFPESAFVGVLAEVADEYSQRYESPKEFVYLDLLTGIGLVLSGRLRADFETKVQPRSGCRHGRNQGNVRSKICTGRD